jgi:hypothetical protein
LLERQIGPLTGKERNRTRHAEPFVSGYGSSC